MGSIAIGGVEEAMMFQSSFEDFQKQTSLMNNCTQLWKELSDHFTSLEQDLKRKSDALRLKVETLDHKTKETLDVLQNREVTITDNVKVELVRVDQRKEAALVSLSAGVDGDSGLRGFCVEMDSGGFWKFVISRKKELGVLRNDIPVALLDCIDPAKFVLEAISEVFPVDKRSEEPRLSCDLGWACVLLLESLIPVVADPVLGNSRPLVTPRMKKRAEEIAQVWKESLDQRGGIENVKTPDVHTFLQHLVTFGIVSKEDANLYRKLVVGSAWRKQMPKLANSLGLGDEMPDMIEELINKGQQVDAVHFTYEVGMVDKFPPVPLLKAYLKDSKMAGTGQVVNVAGRKEQSALRAVIKCIEEYKLELELPPEPLRKRLEQLEKTKVDKKRPGGAVPANKRTRVNNGGPLMPPAKAGRLTNAYVSSFPAVPMVSPTFVHSPSSMVSPTFVHSPSHSPQYQSAIYSSYGPTVPTMYGSRSPPSPVMYSPTKEAVLGTYPGAPLNYPPIYAGYGYQQAYYR
ncbi:hypothetical protein GIB67_028993 [Kingdonia uniflora]|uniref:FRIGIDA-like protein n=1 Tax=Kingdonia uniflora TaxID=39325 RepID=A0A7J7N6R9_9MAGN|nr:hypothetical protein GIB67_028993 [Kingdonia uniflora]